MEKSYPEWTPPKVFDWAEDRLFYEELYANWTQWVTKVAAVSSFEAYPNSMPTAGNVPLCPDEMAESFDRMNDFDVKGAVF